MVLVVKNPPVLQRIFSNELALCIRGPKYWINIIISPSKEHSGLTSFRMDWLDLHAVQETLKRLLQHTVPKHQFFSALPSLWSSSHIIKRLFSSSSLSRSHYHPKFGDYYSYAYITSQYICIDTEILQ